MIIDIIGFVLLIYSVINLNKNLKKGKIEAKKRTPYIISLIIFSLVAGFVLTFIFFIPIFWGFVGLSSNIISYIMKKQLKKKDI